MAASGKHTKLTRDRLDVFTSKDKPDVGPWSRYELEKHPLQDMRVLKHDKMQAALAAMGPPMAATTHWLRGPPAAPPQHETSRVLAEIEREKQGTCEQDADSAVESTNLTKAQAKTRPFVSPARERRVPPEAAVSALAWAKELDVQDDKDHLLQPAKVGDIFGPSWSTHWFELNVEVPSELVRRCRESAACGSRGVGGEAPFLFDGLEVLLVWDCSCEALLFEPCDDATKGDPRPLQAFYGSDGDDRRDAFLLASGRPGAYFNLNETPDDCSPLKARFLVEMACTLMFGNGTGSGWGGIGPTPTDPDKTFKLRRADIVLVDRRAYNLYLEFALVADMARHLPKNGVRCNEALHTANEIMNRCNLDDRDTWIECRRIARKFLMLPDGSAADGDATMGNSDAVNGNAQFSGSQQQHMITPYGHCHIDTAWLWCYEETIRKVARSWCTQLRLMEQYSADKADPRFIFAASQAQQFDWLLERYPGLFQELVEAAKAENGACFVPVGGTWVEMDCNIPSGESFVRQFLYGQRFFKKHFGRRCREFWLPDTFGYSPQLPQICAQSGIRYFLTQKLSWSQINAFPFHTFEWEGLDGSLIFTHFPPTDTYNAQVDVKEAIFHVENYKEKERSKRSLMLFGNGDGGGGPLPNMIERMNAMRFSAGGNVEVGFSLGTSSDAATSDPDEANPDDRLGHWFDRTLDKTVDTPRWVGELYLELHRGTYTSQSNNKKWNRQGEVLLHDTELFCALAAAQGKRAYPRDVIDRCWKLLLLQQFHDVIPGSSVEEVYRDSDEHYAEVFELLTAELRATFCAILGVDNISLVDSFEQAQARTLRSLYSPTGAIASKARPQKSSKQSAADSPSHSADMATAASVPSFLANPLDWERTDVVKLSTGSKLVTVGRFEMVSVTDATRRDTSRLGTRNVAVALADDGSFSLENAFLRASFDRFGRMQSAIHKSVGGQERELIDSSKCATHAGLGNQFVLFDDTPMYWDAWDVDVYHLEKFTHTPACSGESCIANAKIVADDGCYAAVHVSFELSDKTHISQTISMNSEKGECRFDVDVDWHENHKFLKVEFPLQLRAGRATYETQFGCVERPTHMNTSWDVARFEVCGHKWFDFSEPGFGVALLNNCKYGMSVRNNVMRISLLRSPKVPDPDCDMGKHQFTYVFMPHDHDGSVHDAVVRRAFEINYPLHQISTLSTPSSALSSVVSLEAPKHVVLDTVKLAEDDDKALVCRLYESTGQTALGSMLLLNASLVDASRTPVLCNLLEDAMISTSGSLAFRMTTKGDLAIDLGHVQPFQLRTIKVWLKQ